MFALRATVHTTTQFTPAQLIFVQDLILNWRINVAREATKENKTLSVKTINMKFVIVRNKHTNNEISSY